ncbi:MAG: hypothetical protein KatS3mg008_1172 [Acidimicrobiales bacterium]|nr:MAG: hypothetical protein KatS3mg008_1172 [Acidimicrobiales bacterium]
MDVTRRAAGRHSRGQDVIHCTRSEVSTVASRLRDEGYVVCVDVCAVDYLTYEADRGLPDGIEPERFEVVYTFLAPDKPARRRIRVQVPEQDPSLPSLWPLFPGVEAAEREAFDLFGIRFEGHPDLTRILLPEDWEGHPLRKDAAKGRIPVQFKAGRTER